jgi:hypothetical protein
MTNHPLLATTHVYRHRVSGISAYLISSDEELNHCTARKNSLNVTYDIRLPSSPASSPLLYEWPTWVATSHCYVEPQALPTEEHQA